MPCPGVAESAASGPRLTAWPHTKKGWHKANDGVGVSPGNTNSETKWRKLASRQKRQPPNIYSNTPVIFAAMESTAICVNCTLQPFVYTRDSKKRFTEQ